MKIIYLSLIVVSMTGCALFRRNSFEASLLDELTPVYPDSTTSRKTNMSVDIPRNAAAGIHVLLNNVPENTHITAEVTENGRIADNFRWFAMIDVPVEENSGLNSRTELFEAARNPYVIRRAPFRIYDAFDPVSFPLRIAGGTAALRLEAFFDGSARVGKRAYNIILTAGTATTKMRFSINVHAPILPPPKDVSARYTHWFNIRNICNDHEAELWSEPFWEMLRKYADMMVRNRQNTFWVPLTTGTGDNALLTVKNNGTAILDEEKYTRYVRTFLDAGMNTIEISHIARRKDLVRQASELNIFYVDEPITSQRAQRLVRSLFDQIRKIHAKNGFPMTWYTHVVDEPAHQPVKAYKAICDFLHREVPETKVLDAVLATRFTGAIDAWCPGLKKYQLNKDFYDARQAAGDEVWFYVCQEPTGPWLNRLLDQERLRQTYMGWFLSKNRLDGYLHWGLNQHGRGKAFKQSVYIQNGRSHNPPGGPFITYPGKDGPISGQRYAAHRIGMEDYVLLEMLKKRDRNLYTRIIDDILPAPDKYEKNVGKYRKARRGILEALSP